MSAKQNTDTALIDFLMQPSSYPHEPEEVTHIQTHISHVFIAGAYVYKLKKPVDFEFLDFTTPKKREFYCHQEVELNRRLTDGIYLGVVSITPFGDTFQLESGDSEEAVDYVVKMKRLPQEYFLHTFIEEGRLKNQHLDQVAEKLTVFYLDQKPDEDVLKWGSIKNIRYNTAENFRQTKPFIGNTIDENSWQAIRGYTNAYFKKKSELFDRRIEEKRIVDGHGDLHLEHIHISPEAVNIYDCIEFNERFRCGDLAADLAFLAMDLDYNECRKEAHYFVEKMAEELDDNDLLDHINFYKCYRAVVKGKVKSLQSDEAELAEEAQERARETASAYFHLALQYALLGSLPTALVIMGRPATGKSTLAEKLSNTLNLDRYSSDRIRKTLAGLPLNLRPGPNAREKLYAPEMSARTYRRLMEKAKSKIIQHQSFILDATYSKRENRDSVKSMVQNYGGTCYFIETLASDETIRKRLRNREDSENSISDARIEDFEKLDRYYESPDEIGTSHIIRVDTEISFDKTLDRLYRNLIERNLKRVN